MDTANFSLSLSHTHIHTNTTQENKQGKVIHIYKTYSALLLNF